MDVQKLMQDVLWFDRSALPKKDTSTVLKNVYSSGVGVVVWWRLAVEAEFLKRQSGKRLARVSVQGSDGGLDRKSTRLNSSH